jgi:hypothetical protein
MKIPDDYCSLLVYQLSIHIHRRGEGWQFCSDIRPLSISLFTPSPIARFGALLPVDRRRPKFPAAGAAAAFTENGIMAGWLLG